MRREITLEVDGSVVDLYPDTSLTLNFNSSILSDIGSIKCNASQTITLPRTVTNDRVFDLALLPSYDSAKTHRILPCRVYVDGIMIVDNGRCSLLDSGGDEYEMMLLFGILQEYDEWVKSKPKLRDLTLHEEDYVPWNRESGDSILSGGKTQIDNSPRGTKDSMFYLDYENVVDEASGDVKWMSFEQEGSKDEIDPITIPAIHPCVSLLEIWERIRKENSLKFAPLAEEADMENNVIVLTKNNNTDLQTFTRQLVIQKKPYYIAEGLGNSDKKLFLNILNSDFFNIQTSSFTHNGYRTVRVEVEEIYLSLPAAEGVGDGGSDFKSAALASPFDYALVVKPYDQTVIVIEPSDTLYKNTVVYRVNRTIEVVMNEEDNGIDAVQMYIRLKEWESLTHLIWAYPNLRAADIVNATGNYGADYGGWTISLREAFSLSPNDSWLNAVTYYYENNSNDYPLAKFTLVPNLPDISQIDYINFICNLYGLFPVQEGESIRFVRFNILTDNIDKALFVDWSDRLTGNSDTPARISYSMDYAQRNEITYKNDVNDPYKLSSYIYVEDDTLIRDKKLIEFPFAPTHRNRIPQYIINDKREIEKNDCEYRLMRANWEDKTMSFTAALKPQQIINSRYSTLQEAIRKPKVIEEEMTLSLIDLQELDYTKPVYLAKYGRFFAVMSVQWDSGALTSKVKLLMIR